MDWKKCRKDGIPHFRQGKKNGLPQQNEAAQYYIRINEYYQPGFC